MHTWPAWRARLFFALWAVSTRAAAQSADPSEAPLVPATQAGGAPAAASAPAAVQSEGQSLEAWRQGLIGALRQSYLDRDGRTPLPEITAPASLLASSPQAVADLSSLRLQAQYIRGGRGEEGLATFVDMIVIVAWQLGVDPPEAAIPIYHDRTRPAGEKLSAELQQARADLTAAAPQPAFKRRYVFVKDLMDRPADRLAQAAPPEPAARPQPRRKRGRKHVSPPPEPGGPARSVMDSIDWERAEDLAAVAAQNANGFTRRTRRHRLGRCYEWVRKALVDVGLWNDDYRSLVTRRGDRRRPVRAYSFAWAMNTIERRQQDDPFEGGQTPLRRLDLRVDPLVIGSVVVFDRSVCGFDRRSGHIEIITSVEPLRASSYKFHEVKMDCLVKAAELGQVHVYVPLRLDPAARAVRTAAAF